MKAGILIIPETDKEYQEVNQFVKEFVDRMNKKTSEHSDNSSSKKDCNIPPACHGCSWWLIDKCQKKGDCKYD